MSQLLLDLSSTDIYPEIGQVQAFKSGTVEKAG
jgi:hypothetical protein